MDKQTEKAALDDFFAWFTETGKKEVIVRVYQEAIADSVTMTTIKAFTFSPDGALRHFEYQCCEPLNHNVCNLIKVIGCTPNLERVRAAGLDEFRRWPEVFPLFLEHKSVVACQCIGTTRHIPIPHDSINMLTHLAMVYASLLAGSGRKEPTWRDNCLYFLRRWGAMYKQQKAAAVEHAAALAGISVLS